MINCIRFALIGLICTLLVALHLNGLAQVPPKPINEFIDLQLHPTVHMPYPFFEAGLEYFDGTDEPELTHMHQFKNVLYANYLSRNAGARILVFGALNKEFVRSKKRATKGVLEQIEFVNRFAAADSNFTVARSPDEVRRLIHETDQTVIIHSIEGGRALIKSHLTDGMPHPGYLESQWRHLESKGVDLKPIRRSSERFLQIWQQMIDRAKSKSAE